jgi:hypothetical protein
MNLTPPLDASVVELTFGLFRLARLIHAVASLGVASHLVDGPKDAATLARLTGTHAPTIGAVMDALACWGAFSRDEAGRYGLTDFSRRLVSGTPNAANVPMMLGWSGLPAAYEAFGDVMHTLRTGEAALAKRHGTSFHGYLAAHPGEAELYDRAMESTVDSFRDGAQAYDFSAARTLVDVGGGQGAFALEILARNPQLAATCYDLPGVVAAAKVGDHPAASRLTFQGGDAMKEVPAGADIYLTSTVLRCFGDEPAHRLLANVRAAMKRTSRLVAYEMVVPEARDHLGLCMANVVARVLYGGLDRSEAEFRALFAAAGLRLVRSIPLEGLCVLEAEPC